MAINKFRFMLALLVCGAVLLGSNLDVVGVKACPQYCFDEAAYMTCPSSGSQHITPKCNCCLAAKGCTIYKADGTALCTAT